jgi:hypothetical protein
MITSRHKRNEKLEKPRHDLSFFPHFGRLTSSQMFQDSMDIYTLRIPQEHACADES